MGTVDVTDANKIAITQRVVRSVQNKSHYDMRRLMVTASLLLGCWLVGCAQAPVRQMDTGTRVDTGVTRDTNVQDATADLALQDANPLDAGQDTSSLNDGSNPVCGDLSLCNGHCVNIRTDPNNCGGCGHVCIGQLNECIFGRCDCTNC